MPDDVARRRLANHRLTGARLEGAPEVVRWMGAVQAQDRPASLWALALRMRAAKPEDIERAVRRGDIIRTWPMRGTLHWVPGADARWMLALLGGRAARRATARHRQLGLDAGTLERSAHVLELALAGGQRLTRPEAYAALERAGIATRGQRGIHILAHHAQRGLLCLGPMAGKQPTFALLDDIAPAQHAPADPLVELARRYARSHGPATARDLAWWAGLYLAAARDALARSGARLDGEMWRVGQARRAPPRGTAHLLPAFDELHVAYKDRRASLGRVPPVRLSPGVGLLRPTVALDGQVVGLWTRALGRGAVRVTVSPLVRLDGGENEAIAAGAERYARFLGLALDLHVAAPMRTVAARAPNA